MVGGADRGKAGAYASRAFYQQSIYSPNMPREYFHSPVMRV